MKGLIATGVISLVGSTAFAYASGCTPRIALAYGIGWMCVSLTVHRIILRIDS